MRRAEAGLAREEVRGVDRAGRRSVDGVERVGQAERFERRHHAGGDHAAHGAAFDGEADARAVAVRRAAAAGAPREPADSRTRPVHLYLKMLFGILTCTPRFGRSTSCVIATLPAMLVS